MDKEDIVKILRLLHKCPIKDWTDLDEDASQIDIWRAQAEWIEDELNSMYF